MPAEPYEISGTIAGVHVWHVAHSHVYTTNYLRKGSPLWSRESKMLPVSEEEMYAEFKCYYDIAV